MCVDTGAKGAPLLKNYFAWAALLREPGVKARLVRSFAVSLPFSQTGRAFSQGGRASRDGRNHRAAEPHSKNPRGLRTFPHIVAQDKSCKILSILV